MTSEDTSFESIEHNVTKPEQTAIASKPRFIGGDVVGKHTITYFLGRDVFGEVYSAYYGTTSRKYRLHILDAESPCSIEDAPELIKRISNVHTPCLMRFFASGTDNGVSWMRSEYSRGVNAEYLRTQVANPEKSEENTDIPQDFFTVGGLLNAVGNHLSPRDRDVIIGDILETLRLMHAENLCFGGNPESMVLARRHNPRGFYAKIPFAVIAENKTEAFRKDMVIAANFITRLTAASPAASSSGVKLGTNLEQFANKIIAEPESFSDSSDVYNAFLDILHSFGIRRHNREIPEDDPAEQISGLPGEAQFASSGESLHSADSHHMRRHHSSGHRRKSDKSDANVNTARELKLMLFFVTMILFGALIYIVFLKIGETPSTPAADSAYNSITVIGENQIDPATRNLPDSVHYYTIEQLSGNAPKNPLAAARLAVLTFTGAKGVPRDAARAEKLMKTAWQKWDQNSSQSPDARFWMSYAMLLGLHVPQNIEEAERQLSRLAANGNPFAGLLLGDWLSSKSTGSNGENDRAAMALWQKIVDSSAVWKPVHGAAAARLIYFMYEGRGIPRNPAELIKSLKILAFRGHRPAAMLLAKFYLSGRFTKKNPAEANMWYKRVYDDRSAPKQMRAIAARIRADLFAQGAASNPSPIAARRWYNHAADLGDAKAMKILAEYCETGFGNEHGIETPKEADYWRKKYQEAMQKTTKDSDIFVNPEKFPLPEPPAKNTENSSAKEIDTHNTVNPEKNSSHAYGKDPKLIPLSE